MSPEEPSTNFTCKAAAPSFGLAEKSAIGGCRLGVSGLVAHAVTSETTAKTHKKHQRIGLILSLK
jgi:uncharacterized RmlC-like cupin family protein